MEEEKKSRWGDCMPQANELHIYITSKLNKIYIFCAGIASMTVPTYISECAPAELRGRLVTINNLFITGGQFIASILDGAFSYDKTNGWRFV